MGESEYSERWFRVKDILDIYHYDPTFLPPYQEWIRELNPTRDRFKTKMLKDDVRADWRLRIAFSLFSQEEYFIFLTCGFIGKELIDGVNMFNKWHRRFMTRTEKMYFDIYYTHGRPWRQEVGEAIKKVDRNFAKKFVYWE